MNFSSITSILIIAISIVLKPVIASGNRGLTLATETIEGLRQVDVNFLINQQGRVHYLGSNQQWHFFGQTVSDVSGDMPYDNTFGFRVNNEDWKVSLPYELNISETQLYVVPRNCPYLIDINEAEQTITIAEGEFNYCRH